LQGTLTKNLCLHNQRETVSLHMPGHKGRLNLPGMSSFLDFAAEFDVTELDGLDDLSYPTGVLKNLEDRVAKLYRVKSSVLSVSGASGGLIAAILAVAKRGTELLVPRNAHRSVVHALVLSGLKPRWYEPSWNAEWSVWQAVLPSTLDAALKDGGAESVAGVLVVSPTFAGAVSDIRALAETAHACGVPLIVDEAQGTHFIPGLEKVTGALLRGPRLSSANHANGSSVSMPVSACLSGADLVVHSFHKTLGAMTQAGAVHIVSEKFVTVADVRAALRLVSTSSPNYVLLSSIEQAILLHESQEGLLGLASVCDLSAKLRAAVQNQVMIYSPQEGVDPLHVLLGSPTISGKEINDFMLARGIFCEAVLGSGCLLLLGTGTVSDDIEFVIEAISDLPKNSSAGTMKGVAKPQPLEQVISPRDAFFAPSEVVPANRAGGRISADCLAPCPPGTPVCVPGARVADDEVLACDGYLRVLLESG
jgi:arginine/lysine/ornithine decarboxylase